MLNLMGRQGDDTMAKFETIALLNKKQAKNGKDYYSYADAKPNAQDATKLTFDWKRSIMAFPTKSGKGIAIVRVIEE